MSEIKKAMDTKSVRTLKLSAGWLCLDFANTMGFHAREQTEEFLQSYFDLVEWSQHAGLITSEDEERLPVQRSLDPQRDRR